VSEHFLTVGKSARVVVWGNPATADEVVLALHGYGQLTTYFARHFEGFAHAGRAFIIPEGLNRFYLEGTSGRVGATWMTREERLRDIADNTAYLNQLLEHFQVRPQARLTVFGFSQGVATACRWMAATHRAQRAIWWAGSLPPDVEWSTGQHGMQGVEMAVVVGMTDPYFGGEEPKELTHLLREAQLPYALLRFDGGHRLDAEVLKQLFSP
jgi:dienelactone hydrolase